jgi:two-component system nitrate/nitrite sensor histidine kinase NarX
MLFYFIVHIRHERNFLGVHLVKVAKQQITHSVMGYINLSLFTIIAITLLSIFFSFWMTEQADSDAHAINLSGSMRMQTYHIGLTATHSPNQVVTLVEKLDETWNNSLFTNILAPIDNDKLKLAFSEGYQHWFNVVRPQLVSPSASSSTTFDLLSKQVRFTDTLVNQLQLEAESKIRSLRTLQLFTMLFTTLVGSLIFYLLKNRVEIPLSRLTEAAQKMRDGYIQQRIDIPGKDELALLAESFNQMSQSITETYQQLESRVEARTKELKRSNTVLEYSFGVARKVLEDQENNIDYQEVIDDLSDVLMLKDVELCLLTPQGEKPYLQLDLNTGDEGLCIKGNCDSCKGDGPFNDINMLDFCYKYPVTHHDKQYGVIKVKQPQGKPLLLWQQQLIHSSADQLAIALSLQETKEQEHRLAMLSERTVMARELHDSLAQSLSYLKIQVTRLQKSHDMKKYDLQQPIIDELGGGLSSAYRHLRELLTTFRLKIDEEGLHGAVEQTVKQLKTRTDMSIDLHYSLKNIPLSPSEEIHLLQILREGSQNAVNHSQGTHLNISLHQKNDKTIVLTITDDGVGLSNSPEKLNHYGLAIIKERSRHLHGELAVKSTSQGVKGTQIMLQFSPNYLKENSSAAQR